MRLRRVTWNPWKSNGKLRNMKNQSFEVLFHKQIRSTRRGSKDKSAMRQFLMTVMSATFGALPEVQFMHAISIGSQSLQAEGRILHGCESPFCYEYFAAILHSAVEFPLKFPDSCDTLEAEHRKLKANFAALRNQSFAVKKHPLVISYELEKGSPRLKITLNGYKFVDYSLHQGAPAAHESTDTPIGHESYMIKMYLKVGSK
ncbi:hypothetical protein CK203_079521 [Vitis vinifera]|uniref:Uncharacterized protein n=1 Tax=Vitis vinifera TaxID=29760 RepID=A0A438CP40_VITVI|nr:hypothetical protein CK203_079521 [Vitis vinifera]